MNAIDHMLGGIVSATVNFFVHTLAPWAWDHAMWIAVVVPLIVILAIAKWMWD